MKIMGLSHLGIAHKDRAQAKRFFGTLLGLPSEGSEIVESQKVEVDFFSLAGENGAAGASGGRVELLDPTSPDSSIAKYKEKFGSGVHHMALRVDDLVAWIGHLKKNGVKMIDESPRPGAHHTLIAFVHPHSTGGILVELVQENS